MTHLDVLFFALLLSLFSFAALVACLVVPMTWQQRGVWCLFGTALGAVGAFLPGWFL